MISKSVGSARRLFLGQCDEISGNEKEGFKQDLTLQ